MSSSPTTEQQDVKRYGKQNYNNSNNSRYNTNLPSIFQKKSAVNENTRAKHVGFVETIDQEKLYYQIFTSEKFAGVPKAIVFLCHGFGEHVGLFEEVGQRLASSDYCVVMYDQRGFGRSTGKRGHMKRFVSSINCIPLYSHYRLILVCNSVFMMLS
jgi:predicted acyl esterase